MLHLTNGDTAVAPIRGAGVPGEVVPWRDVLHEGPVPGGLGLRQLSRVRARFIADAGWGDLAAIEEGFATRDAALEGFRAHDEVVLWFEHDLYDQLQLVQILAWLAANGASGSPGTRPLAMPRLALVATDDYLGVIPGERFPALFAARVAVGGDELALARRAWEAFTAPDPRGIVELLAGDTAALPFLAAALRRLLEELPSARDGLSRTERQALEAIAAGRSPLLSVYRATHHEREEAIFLGDAVFLAILERASRAPVPLLTLDDGSPIAAPSGAREDAAWASLWSRRAVLTDAGREVLAGRADHVALNGVERWLGGVRLSGSGPGWRWDAAAAQPVVMPPSIG